MVHPLPEHICLKQNRKQNHTCWNRAKGKEKPTGSRQEGASPPWGDYMATESQYRQSVQQSMFRIVQGLQGIAFFR